MNNILNDTTFLIFIIGSVVKTLHDVIKYFRNRIKKKKLSEIENLKTDIDAISVAEEMVDKVAELMKTRLELHSKVEMFNEIMKEKDSEVAEKNKIIEMKQLEIEEGKKREKRYKFDIVNLQERIKNLEEKETLLAKEVDDLLSLYKQCKGSKK